MNMYYIDIPNNVNIKIGNTWIKITGPLGTVIKKKSSVIKLYLKNKKLYLLNNNNNFLLSILEKIIWGVVKSYSIKLQLVGVGYKAAIQNNILSLKLGFSHEIEYIIPENINISFSKQKSTVLVISGIDKQQVNQVAANIRKLKKPEPYKGKGILYFNEKINKKEGKRSNV